MSTEVERREPVATGGNVNPSDPVAKGVKSALKSKKALEEGSAEAKLEAAGIKLSVKDTAATRRATRPTESETRQATPLTASEIGAISRFAEKRTREYMDKFYGGMGKLGITEDQVVSHQRVLRQEALRKGEDFTKEDRQNLTHQLRRAALNPDSDEAQQFAQKVKESHAKVQAEEARAQRQVKYEDPNSPGFMFPIPKTIRELPGASEYPKVMAQLFPDATRVSAWKLLRAEELLTAHIKAGLNPDTFNFDAPIVLPKNEQQKPATKTKQEIDQEQKVVRDRVLKDIDAAGKAMEEAAAIRREQIAGARAERDAKFKELITQRNYEASVKALESSGVAVSDKIKEGIMNRERALAKEAESRAERNAELISKLTERGSTVPNNEASVKAKAPGDRGVVANNDIKESIIEKEKILEKEVKDLEAAGKRVPGFLKLVLNMVQKAVKVVKTVMDLFGAPPTPPDRTASVADNVKAQPGVAHSTGIESKGIVQEKDARDHNPLAEHTAEVEAKLERAGVKIEEQSEVAVDVSRLSTTARSTDNSSQLRDTSAQVAQKSELRDAVQELAGAINATSQQEKLSASIEQQPAAVQQQQSARSR
ncbi:hypothetical protein ACIS_01095 [Anaplasma centrale str. Israel]|uniref:Uncharacterized protein n=1 Tax=Anaplasma centrale (strain Israel) TaxID=574556 RepID=D1ASW2_ANACI|nr:hypothetical protein [Anaplasma centrale]ACZ49565.1 hypothetical protein ACIS_01095 [Anaplasma centrale str. Israel]